MGKKKNKRGGGGRQPPRPAAALPPPPVHPATATVTAAATTTTAAPSTQRVGTVHVAAVDSITTVTLEASLLSSDDTLMPAVVDAVSEASGQLVRSPELTTVRVLPETSAARDAVCQSRSPELVVLVDLGKSVSSTPFPVFSFFVGCFALTYSAASLIQLRKSFGEALHDNQVLTREKLELQDRISGNTDVVKLRADVATGDQQLTRMFEEINNKNTQIEDWIRRNDEFKAEMQRKDEEMRRKDDEFKAEIRRDKAEIRRNHEALARLHAEIQQQLLFQSRVEAGALYYMARDRLANLWRQAELPAVRDIEMLDDLWMASAESLLHGTGVSRDDLLRAKASQVVQERDRAVHQVSAGDMRVVAGRLFATDEGDLWRRLFKFIYNQDP
eukprot:TRINITY_DN4861_c0_g1_i1.p1 TRINITY_DN4861_c0_g1~~TRINITY_DN4861_c0_g1_i1.p1  ORF type:complete len:387 (-),score=75.54 TRINITY_DN4861_c0_g1_i1:26-1186(-)